MAANERTFGGYLKRFALSVDIVDEGSFKRVGELVEDYVAKELQIEYFEVMQEAMIDDEIGLATMWCSEPDRNRSKTILDDQGTPRDQTALSFHLNKPLWVLSVDHGSLEDASQYADLWSGIKDLPPYRRPSHLDIQTSIVVPLARGRRKLGVIYLESTQYVEITEVAKQELQRLADSVTVLCLNRESTSSSRETTGDALSELANILNNADLPRLAKPQVFVACSSSADQQVVGTIMNVLHKYNAKVTPVLWSDIRDSGPIDRQIVEAITKCRFGVCYLSEEDEDQANEWKYRDNANVLFEAGMLHSLTSTEYTGGWIPIREEDSPPPPFDFAHERIEIVPRLNGNTLNKETFEANLSKRIEHVLEGE